MQWDLENLIRFIQSAFGRIPFNVRYRIDSIELSFGSGFVLNSNEIPKLQFEIGDGNERHGAGLWLGWMMKLC